MNRKVLVNRFFSILLFICHVGLVLLFFVYQILLRLYGTFRRYKTKLFEKKIRKPTEKLVIIGGGFAGSYAAKKLELHFSVTLIDTRDYFEFTPSVLRTIVEPTHLDSIQILYRSFLDIERTTIMLSKVNSITQNSVILKKGKVYYDYLLVCSGSGYNKPFKEENVVCSSRGQALTVYYQRVCQANKILVIGGGIVGVELAAEIIEAFPDKEITLVHSGDRLMNRTLEVTPKASKYSENFLKERGVKILFQEKINSNKDNQFTTQNGNTIECDLAFACTGIKPHSKFLKNSQDQGFQDILDAFGYVRVNKNLQLHEHPNILAAGDIASIAEEKLAQSAEASADVAVKNLILLKNAKAPEIKLAEYHPVARPLLISLGKLDGILLFRGWTYCGFLPAVMKQFVEFKTMVSYRYRSPNSSWVFNKDV